MAGIVAAHNAVRADHCAPPLAWSDELAAVAQRWADELRDRGCAFEHSNSATLGENMAYFAPAGTATVDAVVGGWYREESVYDFAHPRFSFEAGHFSQLVWRSTTHVGCGAVQCGDQADIWVCNYEPPGNVEGLFADNVRPASCQRSK